MISVLFPPYVLLIAVALALVAGWRMAPWLGRCLAYLRWIFVGRRCFSRSEQFGAWLAKEARHE